MAACLRRMQRCHAGLLPNGIITREGTMEQQNIPYFAHEGIMARMERSNRRLWILCIILIILLAGTNAAWFYHESQFEDVVSTEISQDVNSDDGGNAIINDGVHINGESTTDH